MQKILLAIDGITPDKKALYYAVELCKRIKAELSVLEVISPRNSFRYFRNWGERVNKARKYVEDSMVAVTFAQAGEHELAKAIQEEAEEKFSRLFQSRNGMLFTAT
jgi:nucleotide-binding universal stress UspA family protein